MSTTRSDNILPWYSDPELRRPVFVVGMNGSGTTMLVDCLDRHPALYGFPLETRLIPHLIRIASRFEPLTDDDNFRRLWRYVTTLTPFRLASGGEPQPLPDGWESCTRDLAGLLNMLFVSFAHQRGKHLWCEKSPQNAQHMLKIRKLFPRARFIHVIRDGRDCACSFHRRWGKAPELTMLRWKQLVRTARAQGRILGSESYMEVHYEDLTKAPEYWMRRICSFLSIAFDPVVLESSQPYLGRGGRNFRSNEAVGSLKPNSGRWREHFGATMRQRLDNIGGQVLDECGYPTGDPNADRMPPRWRQWTWIMSDGAHVFVSEINAKLHGRIERPWWSILSRPVNAVRQHRENSF